MKLKTCPECEGKRAVWLDPLDSYYSRGQRIPCPTCEGSGTIPAELTSHCLACGEPIELGQTWCEAHQAAAAIADGDS